MQDLYERTALRVRQSLLEAVLKDKGLSRISLMGLAPFTPLCLVLSWVLVPLSLGETQGGFRVRRFCPETRQSKTPKGLAESFGLASQPRRARDLRESFRASLYAGEARQRDVLPFAPTGYLTKIGLMTNQIQEFFASLLLILEDTNHGTGNCPRARLLYTPHRHTHMRSFHHHGNSLWL